MDINSAANPDINMDTDHRNIYKKKTNTKTNTRCAPAQERESAYDLKKFEAMLRTAPVLKYVDCC